MTGNIVENNALTLRAPTQLHAYRNSKDLKKSLIKFAQQQARESTHHIILATHRPMTMHQSRLLLKKWDMFMNGQVLGGRWTSKPHLNCEWIAFPEHVHSDPHWHLLWRMSPDLEAATVDRILNGTFMGDPKYSGRINGQLAHGLPWIVHRHWKMAVSSGTSKVVPKFEPERLGSYVTKGQRDTVAYDNIVTSGEFKTNLPKAA